MGTNSTVYSTVFGSQAERRNFLKLTRQWRDAHRIYPNLPFLHVFTLKGVGLNAIEGARLKKTSIAYTLCDEHDRPILCIEFDGLNEGFNVGSRYFPDEHQQQRVWGEANPWRQEIMELKLKVAMASEFPFFVVGSKEFADLSTNLELTMVDGIIGVVLACQAFDEACQKGAEWEEQFDSLQEVKANLENNPIAKKRWELYWLLGVTRRTYEPHFSDTYEGATVTIPTEDFGEVSAQVWLPNFQVFGWSGLQLCEDMATLLALEKLRKLRKADPTRGTSGS